MLKLHGFAVSNYFNMVKLALLEKGLDFEVVKNYPAQEEAQLQKHPLGKVPVLETEHGFLSETGVILDYLEQAYPQATSLMPQSTFAQAQVKELVQMLQLYLELPARRCFGEVFFDTQVPQLIKDATKQELLRGIAGLKRKAVCAPFLAGESLSTADIVFVFSVDLAVKVAHKLYAIDLLQDFEQAKELIEILNSRPHVKQIIAERDAELAAFLQAKMKASQKSGD